MENVYYVHSVHNVHSINIRGDLMKSTVERISAKELRSKLGKVMNRVAYGKRTAIITMNGADHVAMIAIDELEKLREQAEDYLDIVEARAAREEYEELGGVPWEQVKKELNIE